MISLSVLQDNMAEILFFRFFLTTADQSHYKQKKEYKKYCFQFSFVHNYNANSSFHFYLINAQRPSGRLKAQL